MKTKLHGFIGNMKKLLLIMVSIKVGLPKGAAKDSSAGFFFMKQIWF